jgi:type VI secretion system secreted protein Hcp
VAVADYFLKIDGIAGESQDSKHKGEIQLESFGWGESQLGAGARGAGAGTGKVEMQDFHFAMRVSKASPQLLLACASGKHFKSAVLTARKAGKDQQEFLVYKFTDLSISSYQTVATLDHLPLDQVAFSFGQITVEYRPQQPTGALGTPVQAAWDVRANRAL